MGTQEKKLKKRLKDVGLSNAAISAAWPEWWSEEAELSASAVNELQFTVARKLGLSPRSLFEEGAVSFRWYNEARFKGLSTETESEQGAIASFGVSVARLILSCTPDSDAIDFDDKTSANALRAQILKSANSPFVGIKELLAFCWGLGIPIVQLRVFPLSAKRMAAMSVKVDGRYAILIGRDAKYPAPISFLIAHELGHIFGQHLTNDMAVVDMGEHFNFGSNDAEEVEADQFALELLTGSANPKLSFNEKANSARSLAQAAETASVKYGIEPGTIALCYGHKTGDWALAVGSLKHIYDAPRDVWSVINNVAMTQINLGNLVGESSNYLRAVLGAPTFV